MTARVRPPEPLPSPLPNLRFEIIEAAQILRMSRAQLYNRIQEGCIHVQKDGSRSYITHAELERYVDSCAARTAAPCASEGSLQILSRRRTGLSRP